MIGYAFERLGMARPRLIFWTSRGCGLALIEGVYRLEPASGQDKRWGPCPAPIAPSLAREAIASGVPLRVEGELFGDAAA